MPLSPETINEAGRYFETKVFGRPAHIHNISYKTIELMTEISEWDGNMDKVKAAIAQDFADNLKNEFGKANEKPKTEICGRVSITEAFRKIQIN